MTGLGTAFIGYFLVIAAIGAYALARTKDVADYALGGRKLSAPVAALSAGASDMSGWLLLGLPGAVFAGGLWEAWIIIGLAVGAWANWRLVAPRLRIDTHALRDALTLPQFLARRTVGGRSVRITASMVILVFFTLYTSAGFVAGAKLFEQTLGLDYQLALLIGVIVIMAYTALGGFFAVSWSDFFQALLMLLALVVVPAMAWTDVDVAARERLGHEATEFIALSRIDEVGWLGLIGLIAWGLGYFGQPHILARFMAISSASKVPQARRIAMSWMVISGAGAILVGLVGFARFGSLDDPETVFIALSQAVLNPYVAGIVIAAILAAVMSTVDSQLLVASTAIVQDVLDVQNHPLRVSRIMVIVIAVVACLLALDPQSTVLGIVAYAWAGLGASFGPAVLFCLFWRQTNPIGVVLGMVVGALTVIVWRNLSGGLFDLYEIVPAFCASSLVIYVAGLFAPSDVARQQFEALRSDDGSRTIARDPG